jgi:hypothetical protein
MKREAARVVREGLLKLRKDPHMMHQANLAMIDGVSLLMRWTQVGGQTGCCRCKACQ